MATPYLEDVFRFSRLYLIEIPNINCEILHTPSLNRAIVSNVQIQATGSSIHTMLESFHFRGLRGYQSQNRPADNQELITVRKYLLINSLKGWPVVFCLGNL